VDNRFGNENHMAKAKKKKLPSVPRLKRKALQLWYKAVKDMHGHVCAVCGSKHPMLNAHHIESKTNSSLKFDLVNGVALCPGCHAFGHNAAHRTIFFYEWLAKNRPKVIEYIRTKRDEVVDQDRECMEKIIKELCLPPSDEILTVMNLPRVEMDLSKESEADDQNIPDTVSPASASPESQPPA